MFPITEAWDGNTIDDAVLEEYSVLMELKQETKERARDKAYAKADKYLEVAKGVKDASISQLKDYARSKDPGTYDVKKNALIKARAKTLQGDAINRRLKGERMRDDFKPNYRELFRPRGEPSVLPTHKDSYIEIKRQDKIVRNKQKGWGMMRRGYGVTKDGKKFDFRQKIDLSKPVDPFVVLKNSYFADAYNDAYDTLYEYSNDRIHHAADKAYALGQQAHDDAARSDALADLAKKMGATKEEEIHRKNARNARDWGDMKYKQGNRLRTSANYRAIRQNLATGKDEIGYKSKEKEPLKAPTRVYPAKKSNMQKMAGTAFKTGGDSFIKGPGVKNSDPVHRYNRHKRLAGYEASDL